MIFVEHSRLAVPVSYSTINMKKQSLGKAFYHAFSGLFHFFLSDRNGRIHLLACVLVTLAGFYFHVSATEWVLLLICFALVTCFEMCNHALENLADVVHSAHHPLIKTVKDVAAAAVLFSAITSVVIALIIFVPKISMLL
jgi:diacylglycerol kinase